MQFSQRYGYVDVRTVLQYETIDDDLRLDLWNYVSRLFDALADHSRDVASDDFRRHLWCNLLRRPVDEMPSLWDMKITLKRLLLEGQWHRTYDFLEFLVGEVSSKHDVVDALSERLNKILESNLSAYRLLDGQVVPIDSEVELVAIEDALAETAALPGARHHLQQALILLADRTSPDYNNSVKESISAVESICVQITSKNTLGAALRRLKDRGLNLHSSLEEAWLKLYGYTSDEDGIRHAAARVPTVDQAQAKYFLITCSAFVSLLIAEAAKAGINLNSLQDGGSAG